MFCTDTLLAEARAFCEHEWAGIEADLRALVAINSAKGTPAGENAPYGPGPRAALDWMLARTGELGLATCDCEGHIGYADLSGTASAAQRKQLGIIGHLDVVPAGGGWSTPSPFTLMQREGCYVGRGVSDDKGPLLMAVHALRFWIERNRAAGVAFPHDVRLLFGCDEECGMGDASYYLAHHDAPDFLFTPDAEFPVCYGEKGQYQVWVETLVLGGAIRDMSGGSAMNAVPAQAKALVTCDAAALGAAEGIDIESAGRGLVRITASGVTGHAAMPEGAVSAFAVLARYLLAQGMCSKAENAWLELIAAVGSDYYGTPLGFACEDEHFGPLTCVNSMLAMREGRLRLSFDCRFPACTSTSQVEKGLQAAIEPLGGTIEHVNLAEPLLCDPATPQVEALRAAYTLATGIDAAPVTMGGGTYAHHFPNAVSFGAEDVARHPRPAWAGGMHATDEAVPVAELKDALVIYILAIGKLMDVL